ncbi:hypothetical protein Ddye_014908 [Dipteronia dyeriana]|uniref:J domain-containing protein n=1 Tax=Dipteronia dyeriana TaxID=168575 RepID=A0AAD9U4Y3_9ROSI|nr:hypothetical protein Ddye_014908 [Dipteronia dyeriana]
MMNKARKKLWKAVSDVVGRTLPYSTSRRFETYNPNNSSQSQTHFLNSLSSSSQLQIINLCPPHRFSQNVIFSGKNFCSESADNSACWNCNAVPKAAPFLFCQSCRTVQPLHQSLDYFQIYGLDKNYEIEDENMERKYKDWQKKLHPDLVHSKSQREREYAAEQSARVIEAYRTLTNPLSRAIYILKLEGIDVNEEETVSDPELLTEIMEIREAVEDAADSKALTEILSPVQEKLVQWSKSFAYAFRNQKFDEALNCIRRMTYYDRVNKEIMKKL